MFLKSMIESCLLFKYEHLTLNIDGDMALWIFRRRAQNAKIGRKSFKIWPLEPSFSLFCPRPLVCLCSIFSGKALEANGLGENSERLAPFWCLRNKIPPVGICRPFPHTNPLCCTLGQGFNLIFSVLEWQSSTERRTVRSFLWRWQPFRSFQGGLHNLIFDPSIIY